VLRVVVDLNQPGEPTVDSVRKLIASASDTTHTQLRVTKAGIAFISNTDIGADNIADLALRLETWSQGTDHVGPNAAADAVWVSRVHKVLRDNWPKPSADYIDMY
jgi:hypothetical protein